MPAGHFIHHQPPLRAGLFSTCPLQDKALRRTGKAPPDPPVAAAPAPGSFLTTTQFVTAEPGQQSPPGADFLLLPTAPPSPNSHVGHAQIHVAPPRAITVLQVLQENNFASWQQRGKPHLMLAQIEVLMMPIAVLPTFSPRVGFGVLELSPIAWHTRSISKRSV